MQVTNVRFPVWVSGTCFSTDFDGVVNTMPRNKMIPQAILSAALATALGTASAAGPVATVSQIQGVALVSQGADYVTAKQGMALLEADRVMAMEGGSVTLTYIDGCKLDIADNQVFTVGNARSCSQGTLSQRSVGPYLAAAPALGTAAAGSIAAGILGAVVVVGLASDNGSDNRRTVPPPSPISP